MVDTEPFWWFKETRCRQRPVSTASVVPASLFRVKATGHHLEARNKERCPEWLIGDQRARLKVGPFGVHAGSNPALSAARLVQPAPCLRDGPGSSLAAGAGSGGAHAEHQ
ncbi:hypothetical protein SAV14893_081250 [Streptomyces avermitilis]|uniref:Uncharacterized protein n=1 Tax=Streptomyces avermitilis TaxID=33903 RepID=A0A4D4MFV0_STRAX|nr:hypothetical protein SAV14893_081250 [Streptomyces avermitilis]GDY70888.1 hypothetical protein SAV31267_003730 [Streptomyces avermitilis]